MDDTDLGTLTRQGDRWMLIFTRRLAHPREKVWRAVTEPEHLAAWYPQEIVGERRAGAPLRFVGPAGYVVTFRQTDPLYTVDLRDPTAPAPCSP